MRYHLIPSNDLRNTKAELQQEIAKSPINFGLNQTPTSSETNSIAQKLQDSAKVFSDIATKCSEKERTKYIEKEGGGLSKGQLRLLRLKMKRLPDVFYLYNKKSMSNLVQELKPGDTICLHGEGQPFLIGLNNSSSYDLDATKFADLLHSAGVPDGVNIELIACNSAIDFHQGNYVFNFARDTSEALHYLYNYQDINVSGFQGLVVDKESGKFSVSKTIEGNNKGDNMSLDRARITYHNGINIFSIGETVSKMQYGWATRYIAEARHGKDRVLAKKTSNNSAGATTLAAVSLFSEQEASHKSAAKNVEAPLSTMNKKKAPGNDV